MTPPQIADLDVVDWLLLADGLVVAGGREVKKSVGHVQHGVPYQYASAIFHMHGVLPISCLVSFLACNLVSHLVSASNLVSCLVSQSWLMRPSVYLAWYLNVVCSVLSSVVSGIISSVVSGIGVGCWVQRMYRYITRMR